MCRRVRHQPSVPKRARRTLEEALRRSVVVNIDYTDANADATTRSVDPAERRNVDDTLGWVPDAVMTP